MHSKVICSEAIGVDYETLELSPEAQRYLETDVTNLICATLKAENWYGISWNDMFQECMIAATKAMLRYDGAHFSTKVTTYIVGAIKNAIKMEIRRLGSHKAKARRNELSFEASEILYEPDMEDRIIRNLKAEWLDWAVDDPETGLTDEERQVIQMSRIGYSQTEIGKIIGYCQSEISKRNTRAVQKLRNRLGTMIEDGTVQF